MQSIFAFNKPKVILKSSAGSEDILEIFNTTEREVLFTAKPNIPHCLKLCGKDSLRVYIGSQEKMCIVIRSIDEIRDRGDHFYITFEAIVKRKMYRVPVRFVEEHKEDKTLTLVCFICQESYDSKQRIPRLLKCGHTLCETCLKGMIAATDEKCIKCPLDKEVISIDNDIQSFPKNFALFQLLDESDSARRSEKREKSETENQKTKLIVDEAKVEEPRKSVSNVNQLACIFHPQENGRFICTTSDCKVETKLMCSECMVENGKHENHSYILSKNFMEKRAKFGIQLDNLKDLEGSLKQETSKNNQTIEILERDYAVLAKEIKHLYSDVLESKKSERSDIELKKVKEWKKEAEQAKTILEELESNQNSLKVAINQMTDLLTVEIPNKNVMEKMENSLKKLPASFEVLKSTESTEVLRYYENIKCQMHSEENVKFYCTSTNCSSTSKLMCTECMSENGVHEEHSYGLLKTLNENRGKLTLALKSIEKVNEKNEEKLAKGTENISKLDDVVLRNCKRLKEVHAKELELIELKRKRAENVLKKCYDEKSSMLKEQKEHIESALKEIWKLRSMAENVLKETKIDKDLIDVMDNLEIPVIEVQYKKEPMALNTLQICLDDEWNLSFQRGAIPSPKPI